MKKTKGQDFVVGIDFGTDSVRAVIADVADGSFAGMAVSAYGRWSQGKYCDPRENRFRQHPLDYVESMEGAVREALSGAGREAAARVRGISIDTTGSTPCLADAAGQPLALDPRFSEDPDAMFILWKDHSSVAEAARINEVARSWGGEDFTKYVGGIYSSEWFWAKALHVVVANKEVAAAAATVIEHCDWMPALLTGARGIGDVKRSRCAMGHKAMWHASWGGYPTGEFLALLHPRLADFAASLGTKTYTADSVAGRLSAEWARHLGLPEGVVVAVGAYDAHIGALGGNIVPGTLLRIMGTSTCDIMIGPKPKGEEGLVRGICGQVDGSVVPGWVGYEAGQSAFGDAFAWFRGILSWPLRSVPGLGGTGGAGGFEDAILPALEAAASKVDPEASGVIALDWLNGRRTPDADQSLTAAISGLRLGTDAPAIYRALIEAVAFGSRAIVERLRSEGVVVERVAAVGGVARKSPLVMQVSADVLGMPIEVAANDQACALGAAMFAATAAGLYSDVLTAQAAMRSPVEKAYQPDPGKKAMYDRLYARYKSLGTFMSGEGRGSSRA